MISQCWTIVHGVLSVRDSRAMHINTCLGFQGRGKDNGLEMLWHLQRDPLSAMWRLGEVKELWSFNHISATFSLFKKNPICDICGMYFNMHILSTLYATWPRKVGSLKYYHCCVTYSFPEHVLWYMSHIIHCIYCTCLRHTYAHFVTISVLLIYSMLYILYASHVCSHE